MWTRLLALVIGIGLVGCGDAPPPPRPDAPTENDPAYNVRVGEWYVVANKATPGHDTMTIFVDVPSGIDEVHAFAADLPVATLARQPDGSMAGQLSVADLPLGTYELLLSADRSTTAFAKVPFHRSAPYYVVVTTDWDFSDPGDRSIGYQNAMHERHSDLRMTHFVGPYTFTDPEMTAERKAALVDWLVTQRDTYRDEIGLHIHPYCHFVQAAGVTCVTDQSTVYAAGDTSGYTIKVSAYDRAQFGTLLDKANELFEANGLNRSKTFRAGGWTADLDTLAALADKGFTADTSALNWAKIEEWEGQMNGELYNWNMMNWGPINDTSQPYWVSESNVLANTAPTLPILEVPDNGAMIDYVTLGEMNALFDANWNGQPLTAPITLMMGFHPAPGFSQLEFDKVDGFLAYADRFRASKNTGPVVYVTLEDLVGAYTP